MRKSLREASHGLRHFALLGFIFVFIFGVSFWAVNLDLKPAPKKSVSALAASPKKEDKSSPIPVTAGESRNVSFLNYAEWSELHELSEDVAARDADPDGDGLANGEEYDHLTDPKNPDTDNDGFRDKQEIENGYDPDAPGEARPKTEITIQKIGVVAPVIFAKSEDEASLAKDLERGAVHFPKSAAPGRNGNAIISGHSSNYAWAAGNYNHIFENLGNLENGDIIGFKTIQRNGRVLLHRYKVSDKYVTAPNDARIFEQSEKPILTLSTCWPLGTAFKRLIIKAELAQ